LWHNYLPANLKIVVFNNQGGGIFRLIEGPGNVPELEEYFETRQVLQAENTAKDFGLKYFKCLSEAELLLSLPDFFNYQGAAMLEIMTENLANAAVYKAFKNDFETN
jgi:2-succinyl-5-enolpyruvyl-6-hydroxy-3-cyclohexene-1-carboxylate synthase